MVILLDILGLVLAMAIAPFLLLGTMVAELALDIRRIFHVPTLGLAVWFAGLALIMFDHMAPTPDTAPFQSVVTSLLDTIGQAHLFGFPIPYVFGVCSGILLSLSVVLRTRTSASV